MTTTADDYIHRVLRFLPAGMPERNQIATELRGHIAERLAAGQSLEDVLSQLGDPLTLAESYLAAVPLRSARFGRRALAKIVDVMLILALIVPIACFSFMVSPVELLPVLLFPGIFIISVLAAMYLVIAEARYSQTLGKRLMSLRVVRESGARISVGQAVVRQLPMFLQMYWIDVLFALFTDKHQRAFELLSKTRVVEIDPEDDIGHARANAPRVVAL